MYQCRFYKSSVSALYLENDTLSETMMIITYRTSK